jgi:hypothetical protein
MRRSRRVDAAGRHRERYALTTRIGAIIGLGRLGSGGSAANPSEYPSALRSTLPGAATKAIVLPETGFIWGMSDRGCAVFCVSPYLAEELLL